MIIAASEGKVFRRISDQVIFSNEIDLGYTYYLKNKKLDEPLLELPEHFEEIDDPNLELKELFTQGEEIIENIEDENEEFYILENE
jgi:hypothetical protein